MAHPQSSPRGLWAKNRIDIGANQLTGNSTALVLSAGIKVSNAQTLTGNTTGVVFGDPASALPGSVDNGVLIGVLSNSTGVALFINSTGTTHKYLNVTAAQPT
jgi:hypothetical protein